jgi:Sec-independent protein translocase protein TatA
MKGERWLRIGHLLVLLSVLALVSVPAWAQGEIELRSVSPNRGRAGEEHELTLKGRGFCGPATVMVGEFEAGNVRVESDSTIRASLFIPNEAMPGPRRVEVVVDCGGPEETFGASLEEAFTIQESRSAQQGGDEGGDQGGDDGGGGDRDREGGGFDPGWWPWLIVILVVGVIVVGGGAVAVTLAMRGRTALAQKRAQVQQEMSEQAQQQLEAEAEEGELPETCQSGTHKVIRGKPELKPGRWKVTGCKGTLYDSVAAQQGRGGDRGDVHDVPEALVKRIDEAARDRLLWGDSDRLSAEVVEIGRALAAQVVAWQAVSEVGRDVYLEPEIEGGEGSVTYTVYRCVGPPDWWQKIRSWTVKAQVVRHFQRSFRGPAGDEAPDVYRGLLERHLTAYVRDLVREASRLWDTEGVGISVEVSLK